MRILTPALILIATFIASGFVASVTTLRTSKETVERYVSVWEEEVARNLLLRGNAELFEKIRMQILDLASDVEVAGAEATARTAAGACFGGQNLSVTLYGTPAGELKICRSPERLLLRSLVSPVFSFGLLIGVLFAIWLGRRNAREDATRAINELAIRVAHDIRAPIMALKVAAQAKDGSSTESRTLVEAATKRISAIADDLLEESRKPQSSRRHKSSDQSPIAKTIQTSIQDLVREKKITTSGEIVFEVPATRLTSNLSPEPSSHDLERVVSNLLQNAIEATLAKKQQVAQTDPPDAASLRPRILVDTVESEKEISITIRDNGVGIPKEVLPRIGEVGFSYGKQKGNGVGLSSARRWAQDRGGQLDVRSLEGTGTEVRLTLPRQQNQVALQ